MKAARPVSAIALGFVVSGSLVGCRAPSRTGTSAEQRPILFDGMGSHHRTIKTKSRTAQRYFNQGLTWTYAFNHDEAIRSFKACTQHDPDCAICYWGIALCNGPHINNTAMTAQQSEDAWQALQQAQARKNDANPIERDLIDALAARYANPPPEDRKALNEAYAQAMANLWAKHRNDADVGTLYAEAAMNLRPWDLWTKDGKPQPGTTEIIAVLDEVLRLDPENPGANHLYIHATEASPNPSRALTAADRIRQAVPASGHLLHMPSHIDVLTGGWNKAIDQNERAIEADRKYRRQVPKQGFYRVYMAHNQHMLAFACMMDGRGEQAIAAARQMVAGVPEDYARENAALVDGYMGAPYDALKRFGRWDEILREPNPPAHLPITTAMWRYGRGLAYAAKGQVTEAEREQQLFKQAMSKVPADAVFAINKASDVLAIAEHMLAGEIALAKKDSDQAVAELRKAADIENDLMYMEPPEWIQPVRHTLGAVLVDAGRYAEAEQVYREDLAKWPGNGWSLFGLAKALRGQGKPDEAEPIERQFKTAWSEADTKIGSSCLCVK